MKTALKKQPALIESPLRSLLKGFTWRILATLTTIIIALAITGKIEAALKIGSIEFIAKLIIYYAHERAWARIPLGTVRQLLQEPVPVAVSESAASDTDSV